jgi:acetyl-CoA/propionyl-CoA carboxylase carboxyl transferase subunit
VTTTTVGTTASVTSTGATADTRDPRHPVHRFAALFDDGSVEHWPDGQSGVRVARGRIAGKPVISYCTDARSMGGAIGAAGAGAIVAAIDTARDEHLPVVGLWHSGGARLAEGVASMDGVGRMFAAMTAASGRVPQISVVLGPAAGAAAYGPALTDIVVLADGGRMFVTGPDVVRTVTGEQIDMAGLGGVDAHGRRSGVAHVTTSGEQEAMDRARLLTDLLGRQGVLAVAPDEQVGDDVECGDLLALLPESTRRAYDVRPLVRRLLDEGQAAGGGGPVELQARWAPNISTTLGRLRGRTVGVLANNPIRKGGCLDSESAEKAARFVRMCDAFGVPLVVLVDVPGYLPGVDQEWGGVVRRGAKLLYAFAEATVPRVTVITRKAYGGAYIAMNSRSLGATAVFAWPGAEVDVMGAEAAVGILHRKRLAAADQADRQGLMAELAARHAEESGGVRHALDLGVVDGIIRPRETRWRVATALAAAPLRDGGRRGGHGNIPL